MLVSVGCCISLKFESIQLLINSFILAILQLDRTFGGELIVLHATLVMFSRFLVDAQTQCEGLNKGHSISVCEGSNSFWHAMNYNRLLFIRIQTLHPSMHHKKKEIISSVCKRTNGNQRGPTPDKKSH
jgi:hypothetical protein